MVPGILREELGLFVAASVARLTTPETHARRFFGQRLRLLLIHQRRHSADRCPTESKNQWLFPVGMCTPLRVTVISC